MLALAEKNPHGPGKFIFYGMYENKPAIPRVLLNGLHNVLMETGIDAKARGIVFHSWRHYYAARMADRMTADQVSRVTGHKSQTIFEAYADHITEQNLEEGGKVGAEVFGNVLQFRKGRDMEAMELPRIGHKDDAVTLLEQLIAIARANAETNRVLLLGL